MCPRRTKVGMRLPKLGRIGKTPGIEIVQPLKIVVLGDRSAISGLRYYSPGAGRWINRDPAEEDGGNNLYGMVNNDPTDLIDPIGLWDTPTHLAILTDWTKAKNLDKLRECCKYLDPLKELNDGSRYVDGDESTYSSYVNRLRGFGSAQSAPNSYQHGLRELFEDAAQAEARSNTFISERTSAAIRAVKNGDPGSPCGNIAEALWLLGQASHTIMDSFSPAHQGNQLWLDPAQGMGLMGPFYAGYLWNHHRQETRDKLTPELLSRIDSALSARLGRALDIITKGSCCDGKWKSEP